MSKALLAISTAALRETPFFVLEGPAGRRLACQWTAWSQASGRAMGAEFEIVCPETPEAMGCLFGLFEEGEFRMRPAIRTHQAGHATRHAFAPELDLDLAWRGDLNDVLDCGHDWDIDPDGLLIISDPEEPAANPIDAYEMRLAA
jgi:hypothetical protein